MKNIRGETASKILITKVPLVDISSTVDEAQNYLLDNIKKFESVHYIYVIDRANHLKGILSIHELLRHKGHIKITRIMHKKVYYARPGADQEAVAHLALKRDIVAIPIVDKYGVFKGTVPSEALLTVMYKEAREDLLKISGAHHTDKGTDDIMKISPLRALKHRLPWLILGLFGGVFAAQVIGFFENTLEKNLFIASFIPLVVYIGSAVGTQMQAFMIRDYAVNPSLQFGKYFLKNLTVVSLIGLITGLGLFVFTMLFYKDFQFSGVLGLALFIAVLSSITTGLLVPYVFTRFKQDPANASGPVATIIQDILSIIIYFSVAAVLL